MNAPCGMEEERDPRFRRLSIVGAFFNAIAVVFAVIALATNRWASLTGPILGYMGPFLVCQDIPGGVDKCQRGGLGPYKQTWASYASAAGAIFAVVCLGLGVFLCPLILLMHSLRHEVCLKFRHAIFTRLIVISAAAFSSLIACICFILEAKIFLRMQSDDSAALGWSFYMEVITFIFSVLLGLGASYEWRWSRKLGGDPTVYTRDPEGIKADTIINPNFRDGPRTGPSSNQNGGSKAPRNQMGTSRSGGVHRNANGVAMTTTSGLPYSITSNGSLRGGKGSINGHMPNGRQVVAFDPTKTPLRSSLRRPKPNTVNGVDSTDAPTTGVVQNPTFAQTSPTPKKKVRIHTQSTAV